jgi:hypothetical protein
VYEGLLDVEAAALNAGFLRRVAVEAPEQQACLAFGIAELMLVLCEGTC